MQPLLSFQEVTYLSFNKDTTVLFAADKGNNRVRSINLSTGAVNTYAGASTFTDGPGTAARFDNPNAVAVASDGKRYVVDRVNNAIRQIDTSANHTVSTVLTGMNMPIDIYIDGMDFYLAQDNGTIMKTSSTFSTIDTLTTSATGIERMAVDGDTVFFTVPNQAKIKYLLSSTGLIADYAGNGNKGNVDTTRLLSEIDYPTGIALNDTAVSVLSRESQTSGQNSVLRMIKRNEDKVETIAGSYAGQGDYINNAVGTNAKFNVPKDLALDTSTGVAYVVDLDNQRIRTVNLVPPYAVGLLAGNGMVGAMDGTNASFNDPSGIGVNTMTGDVYVTELGNDAIRRITFNANTPPTFAPGPDIVVDADTGAVTIEDWALNISPGSNAFESGQDITFTLTADSSQFFTVQPALDTSGDLAFTVGPNKDGSTEVDIVASDDGGTANGGVDTSPAETFTITINPTTGIQVRRGIQEPSRFFPNPADQQLQLRISKEHQQAVELRIINAQGQLVRTIQGKQPVLNLQDLDAGMYMLDIRSNEGHEVMQFIKE